MFTYDNRKIEPCERSCPDIGGPPHSHFLFYMGRAFSGVLGEFAGPSDEFDVHTFSIPRSGQRVPKGRPSLRSVGESGFLMQAFLPAAIGSSADLASLSVSQQQLLQAVVREASRAKKGKRSEPTRDLLVVGNQIPNTAGRRPSACRLLDPQTTYVAFGGNRCRRGLGYKLTTAGGWLKKAGYEPTDRQANYSTADLLAFLSDLSVLAARLNLTVVGLDRRPENSYDLVQMIALSQTQRGRAIVDRLHLRIYGSPDYRDQWASQFGPVLALNSPPAVAETQNIGQLLQEMRQKRLSQRSLAKGIGKSHTFVCKVLAGTKPWPAGLLERAVAWVRSPEAGQQRRTKSAPRRSGVDHDAEGLLGQLRSVAVGESEAIES